MITGNFFSKSTEIQNESRNNHPPHFALILGSGFFTGYFPFAPGTFGSAVALGFYWFIPGMEDWRILLPVSIAFLFIGIPAATRIENYFGKDPSIVVLDEMVGMWISLLFLPKIWYIAIVTFLLFRFFDIVKPTPAGHFDRMKGGIGIMFDDVIAGIYTNILMHIAVLIM